MIIKKINLHFTILVCSYNVEKYYLKNLNSIYQQEYPNLTIIYINDASIDKTDELVKEYLRTKDNYIYLKNGFNMGSSINRYRAINLAFEFNPKTIIIYLDGDDWFYHNNVLKELNLIYQKEKCDITHGKMIKWDGKIEKKIDRNTNTKSLPINHLKTGKIEYFQGLSLKNYYIPFLNKFIHFTGELIEFNYALSFNPKIIENPNFYYLYNVENSMHYDTSPYLRNKNQKLKQISMNHTRKKKLLKTNLEKISLDLNIIKSIILKFKIIDLLNNI